ncbi:MAG: phosphate starvation-inducible protein PhoH [Bacteroidetes bacterium GWC2_33_15]|nr:MAG: phosphate starvation-inducible protein PhoH [Bacteroidetes bacterium GWA2_33_15]OFX51122.1 MAG: phosphate starvation-inducible protein PhoH [Bacteroidetes bacterium GWC2_33_15]OFX66445.1 MAG: phosphate starvation-inducible protein PhoH [Bacteroidetes bacterium GWB2_32_14]OFX70330.1 MAG: phosphate starvation-inducible protein PhoH [Bacteroidetes bacterium GWD2_33_33]HAN17332.1 phosphate starvation-inducible protein PhoH [Bacteroidales bacterium]
MIEKVIYLEGIEPVNIYGIKNIRFEKLKEYNPKLKIVARGNEIKVQGEEVEINEFEEKLQLIIEYFLKFKQISDNEFESMLKGEGQSLLKRKEDTDDALVYGNNAKPIRARTVNQQKLVDEYDTNDLLFAIGPAGSGKTYTAIALAVRAFKNKEVKRIILTRPAVEAGENLGFLPGDLKEKLDPYLRPLYDALMDMIHPKKLAELIEDGIIEIAPLAYMRGRTLDNAFVILDEAQNTTVNQLKMFLTRMGKNAKFIVTGDITQIDLPRKIDSGLVQALGFLGGIKGISILYFDERDIIRHHLVKYIVNAYKKNTD